MFRGVNTWFLEGKPEAPGNTTGRLPGASGVLHHRPIITTRSIHNMFADCSLTVNGAGKTTTIKCILGLMTPTAGSVRVMGYDPRTRWSEVLRRVSAVLEGSRNVYWRLSARENLEFFTGLHGLSVSRQRPYMRGLLDRFGLSDRADVPVQELSGGLRQKVAVACALALRTPVVFLDEPTLGLDVETSYDLRRLLKELAAEERRTIILSSHDMDVVQDVCRQVIVIRQGRIVAHDTVENLLSLFRTRAYRVALPAATQSPPQPTPHPGVPGGAPGRSGRPGGTEAQVTLAGGHRRPGPADGGASGAGRFPGALLADRFLPRGRPFGRRDLPAGTRSRAGVFKAGAG